MDDDEGNSCARLCEFDFVSGIKVAEWPSKSIKEKLDFIVDFGNFEPDDLGPTTLRRYHAAYFDYGFRKSEISANLSGKSIQVDLENVLYLDWAIKLKKVKKFLLSEAACLQISIDPVDCEDLEVSKMIYFKEAMEVIQFAIQQKELTLLIEEDKQYLLHDQLRKWCESNGRDWCIPPISPTQSKAKKSNHTKELNGANLQSVKKLEEEVQLLKLENQKLNQKLKYLEKDILKDSSKSKTNLLYVIGGLVNLILSKELPANINQEWVFKDLRNKYKHVGGLSRSNLSKLFPAAKRSLDSV
jgi:hypothetical protein